MPKITTRLLGIQSDSMVIPAPSREACVEAAHDAVFAFLFRNSRPLSELPIVSAHFDAAGLVSAPNLAVPSPSNISRRRK